ncbi:MAG: hypothetical protein WCX63_02220 [Methanoregula sp.]
MPSACMIPTIAEPAAAAGTTGWHVLSRRIIVLTRTGAALTGVRMRPQVPEMRFPEPPVPVPGYPDLLILAIRAYCRVNDPNPCRNTPVMKASGCVSSLMKQVIKKDV